MQNSRGSIIIFITIFMAVLLLGGVGWWYFSQEPTPIVIDTYEFKTYDEIQADSEFIPFPGKEIEKKFIGVNNKGQDIVMYTYNNITDKIEGKEAHDMYRDLLQANGWSVSESRFKECDQEQEFCRSWGYLKAHKSEIEVVMNTHSALGMITEFKTDGVYTVNLSPPHYFPVGVIEDRLIQKVLTGANRGRYELFLLIDVSTEETNELFEIIIDSGWDKECGAFSVGTGSYLEGCSNGRSGIARMWITDEFSPLQEVYLTLASGSPIN